MANVSDEHVVKMTNGGDIPGVRGEGACQEAAGVTPEVGNNHINKLLGKPSGRGRTVVEAFSS